MKIKVNFNNITGKIKPMHGIGQPPFLGISNSMMHYLGEAGIPYSRLHDVGGAYGGGRFVDIPNIFRNFDADENDPASYDFTFTDWLIGELKKQNCEPFYRLGVTIENNWDMKAYHIYPPKDFAKWARICEHIIRHYNEGWADGFYYDITYWEIWNEPEGGRNKCMGNWLGTPEQYYELYEVTANHLKHCFGNKIKVGGFASFGISAIAMAADPELNGFEEPQDDREYRMQYIHNFLKWISSEEHHASLDFFSWHGYDSIQEMADKAVYCKRLLEKYGYGHVESILNEWNTTPSIMERGTLKAAATSMAFMIKMQNIGVVDMLNFYDARIGAGSYAGMFNPDTLQPYLTYYGFKAFNEAYKLGNAVEATVDDERVYVCAATDGDKKVLLISYLFAFMGLNHIEFEIEGADLSNAQVYAIDESHMYTLTDINLENGKISLRQSGILVIRF